MFRASPRSWLVLAVPVMGLLVLTYAATRSDPRASMEHPAPAQPLRDSPLPAGGTARLSKCGVDELAATGTAREGRARQGSAAGAHQLGAYDPGPKSPGKPRFTVHAAIRTGDRPLLLDAPLAKGGVTLDLYGPHGEGVRASARGLTATVVDSGYMGKPVKAPASGSFRVDPGKELLLDVDLPAGAVCPGHNLLDVNKCSPEDTNDSADCPVLTLTFADPAIRAYRAETTDDSAAGSFSDRLVVVFPEPDTSEV